MMNHRERLQRLGINHEELLQTLNYTQGVTTLFLSGSVIEGYGNAESDLDIFVIHPDSGKPQVVDFTKGTHAITMEYKSNWRVDTEFWPESQVRGVAKRLDACDPNDWNSCLNISISDLEFVHRIRIGIALQDEEKFLKIQKQFDFEKLKKIILTKYLMTYSGAADDLIGAIASKQYETALFMSRKALQSAIDVYLAFHGETNMKSKWRFLKLQKFGDPALLDKYWALETPSFDTKEAVLEHAQRCSEYAEALTLKVQMAIS